MHDVDAFLKRADDELSEADAHRRRFESLLETNAARRRALEERLALAREELGAAALPDPTPEAAESLAATLRLPELTRHVRQWRDRRAEAAARVAQIEDERLYEERDIRRGRLQHQIDEEQPLLDGLLAERRKMEAIPALVDLVRNGWGTPDYPRRGWMRFFDRAFLQDWRQADAAVETLGETDFDAVRARYRNLVEQTDALGQSQARLRAERERIDGLEQERDALLAAERDAPRELLRDAGQVLADAAAVRPALLDALPDPDTARRALAAADGVSHQTRYLDATSQRVENDLATLLDRAGRLREEERRYRGDRHRYRNKWFTDEQFAKRFGRTARYGPLADRYDRVSDTIVVFDRYDRYDPVGDMLWWDLITDGRIDGDFIPEVAQWRQQHPDAVWDAPPDPDDDRTWDETS